jgi:hypothetical protein
VLNGVQRTQRSSWQRQHHFLRGELKKSSTQNGKNVRDWRSGKAHYACFFRPRPPAFPAFRAISLRCSGVNFVSRALPALRAISDRSPAERLFARSLASATAAGFFRLAMALDQKSSMRKKVFIGGS